MLAGMKKPYEIASASTEERAARLAGKPESALQSATPKSPLFQGASTFLRRRIWRYALSILLVGVAHVSVLLTWHSIGPAVTLFLGAVVISAMYGGRGPGLLATVLASLDLDYTFMPPYNAFVLDFDNSLYLCTFLAVALLTSSLQARRRRAEESLRAAQIELEHRVRVRTAELVQSQEQFSLLVNGMTDHAFFMLDEQGAISSWNAGAEKLLGFSPKEILGHPFAKIWPHAPASQAPSADLRASAPEDRCEYQDWVLHADGSEMWASIVLTRVHDPSQQFRGLAVALRDITERKTLEREILEISERERERIGHDLHDGLGQELTGIALLSTALAEQLEIAGDGRSEHAEQVADLVHDAIQHTRELARGLCPVDLVDEGLPAALRQLADRLGRVPNMQCYCDMPRSLRIDTSVAFHLYRIAQEAISNAVRHGKATRIVIVLHDTNARITLRIRDNGSGISDSVHEKGLGLRLMKYRAKAIRGTLDIERASPCGTQVTCTLEPGDRGAS